MIDNAGRMNFPSRHPLNQSFRRGIIGQADVILAIEMNDLWGAVTAFSDRIVRRSRPITKKGAKIVTLGVRDLYLKSNYQDFGRFQDVDLAIAGDGEAVAAGAHRSGQAPDRCRPQVGLRSARQKTCCAASRHGRESKSDATIGWDASPITTARMCAEVYAQIKDEDWSLVGTSIRLTWPHRLWDFKKPHQWNGFSGGAGVGYNSAGLARRGARQQEARPFHASRSAATATSCSRPARCGPPRITGSRCSTSCRTTAPTIRRYMYLVAMAARHGRGIEQCRYRYDAHGSEHRLRHGGARLGRATAKDRSPIRRTLRRALARAVAVVKRGEPAVVDVVTDPR